MPVAARSHHRPSRARRAIGIFVLGVGGFAVLAGCSSPAPSEPDLAKALVASGISKKVADCTAKALTGSLSDRELADIAERGGGGAPVNDTSVENDSADKLAKAMTKCRDLDVADQATTTIAPESTLVPGSSTTVVTPSVTVDDAEIGPTPTVTAP